MGFGTDDIRFRRIHDAVNASECCHCVLLVAVPAVSWTAFEFQDFSCLKRK